MCRAKDVGGGRKAPPTKKAQTDKPINCGKGGGREAPRKNAGVHQVRLASGGGGAQLH